ncbi:MAG: alpha/beta hydrolase [Prolixibacteraceae bacterium]|nr:alpha/beta hydrolase [Prolixibacteraceae bacterium]
MVKIFFIIGLLLASFLTKAQDITGQWYGMFTAPGTQLRIVFNIEKEEETYKATMDSPDQNATGVPVSSITFIDNKLEIGIKIIMAGYSGELKADGSIEGKFSQMGMSFDMNLLRQPVEKTVYSRPQEPKPPYPYHTEDVKFHNNIDDITLAGTFTRPQEAGRYAAAVLISGSGAQNRDEEIYEHKPFKVLADHLARNGIAVLRFDDRGVNQSGGSRAGTSADFANDVRASVDFLKDRDDVNAAQIGLIGHSEGGIIAPIVAAGQNDVAFIVSLAGTGVPGDSILLLQQALIARVQGASDDEIQSAQLLNRGAFRIVREYHRSDSLPQKLSDYFRENKNILQASQLTQGMSEEQYISVLTAQCSNPWMVYFINYDPAPTLERVKCPFLALNGSKDLQAPAEVNLSAIGNALKKGGNKNYKTKELANLNHLFQECETGSPAEYIEIEETFSPKALNEISEWLKSVLNIK